MKDIKFNVRSVVAFLVINQFVLACDPPDESLEDEAAEVENNRHHLTKLDDAAAKDATENLAAAFAEAVGDTPNKELFMRAMTASPHPEGKLFLPSFLAEHSEFRADLAGIVERQGYALDELLETVAYRGIELYMPVESHRELALDEPRWFVGAQYYEHEVPIGFDDSGALIEMNLEVPPLLPTVMLVPTESFNPTSGAMIGDLTADVRPQALSYFGLWITESHVYNVHEPWTRGNPEIEANVQHGGTRQTLACSEEDSVPEPFRFNQDGKDYFKPFLIATPNQLPDENFLVAFYEDDTTRCVIVEGSDSIKIAVDLIKAGYALWANMEDEQVAVALTNLWTALKQLFGGDDDFIGVIVGGQTKTITATPTLLQMGDKQAYESGWVKMKWGSDVAH